MGKRRKFDSEFKKEAVDLALSRGAGIQGVGAQQGVGHGYYLFPDPEAQAWPRYP
jgi:transposase-like protein